MKQNNVILWVVLTLLAASCSKAPKMEPTEESIEGKALLSFSIDGFAQENLPFPKSPNLQSSLRPLNANAEGSSEFNLRDHVNTIEYKVFKYTTLVDSVRQYASDPNFGTYSKYLPVSTDTSRTDQVFTIQVGAAMLEDGQAMRLQGKTTSGELSFTPNVSDAFYYYTERYLPEGTHLRNVKIRRLVGRVEVVPTDTIPANAGRVEIEVDDVAKKFRLRGGDGYVKTYDSQDITANEVKSTAIQPDDIGKEEKTFSSYFMLKNQIGTVAPPRTVTITAYDKQNKVMMKRVVSNVNLQINQITRLRGPLFSNRANADFTVEVESDWKAEIPEFEF